MGVGVGRRLIPDTSDKPGLRGGRERGAHDRATDAMKGARIVRGELAARGCQLPYRGVDLGAVVGARGGRLGLADELEALALAGTALGLRVEAARRAAVGLRGGPGVEAGHRVASPNKLDTSPISATTPLNRTSTTALITPVDVQQIEDPVTHRLWLGAGQPLAEGDVAGDGGRQ
jgi:hypothetical protein